MPRWHLLLAALSIRPGEERLIGLMLLYAFFMGLPGLVIETTAYTLFLIEYDAQAIPYLYIGFALVTSISGVIYTRLEKQVSFATIMTLNLILLPVSLVFFRLVLAFTEAAWPVAALAIWYDSSWALANLGFWGLATRLFNVQQGKRLFALIGVGLTLPETLIGFFIPLLVRLVGTPNLLLVAAGSFGAALVVQSYLLKDFAHYVADQEEEETSDNQPMLADLLANRYIVLIFAFATLYILSFYILDNAFYAELEIRYAEADVLASFLGVFFATAGVVTMALGAFVSGPLIHRYGVRFGLLSMPVVLLCGTVIIVINGTFFETLSLVFWLVVMTKFLNEILAYTINRAAWQVLYEPLPANQRLRAQTVVESMVKPMAGGLAGVILLLWNLFVPLETLQIAYVLLVVLVAWIWVIVKLNRTYLVVLLQALTKNRFRNVSPLVMDNSTITALTQGLSSPHVGVVIYALQMLEKMKSDNLPTYLPGLLSHPMTEIRLEALRSIEQLTLTSVLPSIRERLPHEKAASVWGASLRTLAKLGGPLVFEEISAYLESPNPHIKRGAMIGLLHNKQLDEIYLLTIRQKLAELTDSAAQPKRILAAQILGEAGNQAFQPLLLKLLHDDEPAVQGAALQATGKLKHPDLWPLVIDKLQLPQVRSIAVSALVAGGEAVLPIVKTALNQENQSREVLSRLARVCGRIQGETAITLLREQLELPDEAVRTQVLQALSQCGYQAPVNERAFIDEQIKAEVAQATWTLATLVDFDQVAEAGLLRQALQQNLAGHRNRLFLWLSFIYNPQSILRVQETLESPGAASESSQQQAYALEILDVLVAPPLKGWLMSLFEPSLTPAQRLYRLKSQFPQPRLTYAQRLHSLITGPEKWLNGWTKACALYTISQLKLTTLSETVVTTLTAPDMIIQETAWWVLFQLDRQRFHQQVQTRFGPDLQPHPASLVKSLAMTKEGDPVMLSLIERVIFLKAVSIFAETPEEILAEVAPILTELEVKSGTTILEKGNPGNSLYIIVDGQVRVHHGDRYIDQLGSGDVFGELALLDTGTRSAFVTALEKTHLLRLDQSLFYELMTDRVEVARGIIRVLVQRLRDLNQRLTDEKSL